MDGCESIAEPPAPSLKRARSCNAETYAKKLVQSENGGGGGYTSYVAHYFVLGGEAAAGDI